MNSSLDLASLDNMIEHSKSPAFMNFSYFYLIYCEHEMMYHIMQPELQLPNKCTFDANPLFLYL